MIGDLVRIALVSISLASASAVAFRDVDSFIGANGRGVLVNQSTSANGSFSIVAPSEGNSITIGSGYTDAGATYSDIAGFRPGIDLATSASAFFYFRDDHDTQADRVNVTLDNLSFINNYKIDAPVFFGGVLAANILVQLNTDGKLSYAVTPQGNLDFYLEYARLDVNATIGQQGTTAIPDAGSSAALLACGLAGIALCAVRRPARPVVR